VAAWCLGQLKKRDYVTIIPDIEKGSLGHLRNPPRFISEMQRCGGPNGRTTRQAEEFVVGCLAGNAASSRYRNTRRQFLAGGRGDREQAIDILSRLVGSDEELRAYFHLLQVRAENLTRRFWPEIEAVAKRLLSDKTLNCEQVREACLDARGALRMNGVVPEDRALSAESKTTTPKSDPG
jgi:hypothetical protein